MILLEKTYKFDDRHVLNLQMAKQVSEFPEPFPCFVYCQDFPNLERESGEGEAAGRGFI